LRSSGSGTDTPFKVSTGQKRGAFSDAAPPSKTSMDIVTCEDCRGQLIHEHFVFREMQTDHSWFQLLS
jgi:hypothetical protein